MGIATFEGTEVSPSAGYPFGYVTGSGPFGQLYVGGFTLDNIYVNGGNDFGVLRASAGYNLHPGTALFATGTNPAGTSSAIRISTVGAMDMLSIKLDTLLAGTGGTVTFTGLKTDGVTVVTHAVTLDTANSWQEVRLPDTFKGLGYVDISGPINFQFDDVTVLTTINGTSGSDLIVIPDGPWRTLGNGGTDLMQYELHSWDGDDFVDGGAGTDDLLLRGTTVLGTTGNMTNVETVHLLTGYSGTIYPALYGGSGYGVASLGMPFSYQVLAVDAFLPAGQARTIDASTLSPGERLIFNAEAETDGQYTVHSGSGTDVIVGGALGDTLWGGEQSDTLVGGGGADILLGEHGFDYLDGGPGGDQLQGGSGNDTYVVDDPADLVIEEFADGTDTIITLFNYTLALIPVEIVRAGGNGALNLTGNGEGNTLFGNEAANTLDGLGGADALYGLGGNDTLLGGTSDDYLDGGAGADSLSGGSANDTYVVDNMGDTITEAVAVGTDTVYVQADYALNAGAHIEQLIAAGPDADAPIAILGNEFASNITGNGGNNALYGYGGNDSLFGQGGNDYLDGGTGNDNMIGGLGDDVYVVDSGADGIGEDLGEGNDTVYALTHYTLGSSAAVENLIAGGPDPAFAFSLSGNNIANAVTGNNAANWLYGLGGADTLSGLGGNDYLDGGSGDDFMAGGTGNDTFVVDSAADGIGEAIGQGSDTVYATTSYVLSAGASVETLQAGGPNPTAAIDLTGNELANNVIGNAGNNILNGGAGNDLLIGNGGNDIFAFANALGPGNVDIVSDFAGETIAMDDAVFTGLPTGYLAPSAFRLGTSAIDADDRIIYDQPSGALFFDPDGTGAAAQVHFATLQGGPTVIPGYLFVF